MKKTVFLLSFITLALGVSAQITSTFDTDADGWTFLNSVTPITPIHSTTGGNPAGFISAAYSANVSITTQSWIAPAKFLGSQVVRSIDMNLRFDLQQSQAGTNSNANGDVRIESSSIRLVYSLPVKPAVAPSWSSYSLKLDETQGWRLNNTTGTFATRTQIIAALSNITAIEIRGTYATNATYISGIDNVILEQRTLTPPPTIASFTPTSGEPGTVLTITGTNFDTTPTNNAVYFGAVAGSITSASATQLNVTIPIGASHSPITVINKTTGVSKRSERPFNPTFTEGGRIIPASFKPRFDILLDPTAGNDLNGLVAADLDGDGWNDLLVTESSLASVSIFRNLGSGGNLSAASFAPKFLLANSGVVAGLHTHDLDGDGKLDVISTGSSNFATYRNTSTPGNLSFEPVEMWSNPIVGFTSDVVDVDGDGRLDIIGQHYNGSVAGDFWIALNISSPGNIEFGGSVSYFGGSLLDAGAGVTSGDLDNDGKPDLIVRHSFGSLFSIIKNNSTPGSISLGTPIQFAFGSYGDINISDFNGDGKNDIAWKNGFSNDDIRIRINTNSGGVLAAADFATEVILNSELTNYGGMSVADVNGDGKPDIIASDAADVGVFENNYSGGVFDVNSFVSAFQLQGFSAATYPFSPIVVDLNGDKKPELILGYTNSSPIRISILENKNVPAPVISLNTVSPLSAPVGATVTITGNNFSTVLTDNEVWFGDVRATVLTASAAQLTVTVPAGAAYAPVSVRKGELSSSYHLPFSTSFSSGVTFNATHFAPPITYTLAGADYDIEVGDLDLDGKPDVIADGTGQIPRLFQNTHASGAISGTSLTSAGAVANSAANAKLVDVDGDGKLDIVGGSGRTFPNQSTVGSILFGTEINSVNGDNVTFGDLNQDGKTDLAAAAFSSGSAQLILQENRSNVGTFVSSGAFGTFSTSIAYTKASRGGDVTIADFDNDGFNDVVSLNPFTDNMSIFRNAQRLRVSATTFDPRVEIAVGDNPLRSYPADFDRDGKIDLLVTHWTGTSTTLLIVFQNTSTVGTISFNRFDITNPSTVTIATVADLDGDGKPEILTTSESGNRFSIFKNLHTSGALTAASFEAPFNTTVTAPRGITTGDLNLDGKPEIIITRAAGLLVVYENLIPSIPPPTITSFTPTSGPTGTIVTILGTNFSTTSANNIVYFGATRASVTSATSTQLMASVPVGATFQPISVEVNGLIAYSSKPFVVTFADGGVINACAFETKKDFATGIGPQSIFLGDLDGDGKSDMVVANVFDNNLSVLRNTTTSSANINFTTKVDFTTGTRPVSVAIGDLDGDGKLDLAVANETSNTISVFRNTSSGVGNISFATKIDFATAIRPMAISIGDFDKDGKTDLTVVNRNSSSVSVFRNTSSGIGNINYAAKVDFTTGSGAQSVSSEDFDGDGKLDLVVTNESDFTVSIFRNTSSGAGNINYATKIDFATGPNPIWVAVGDLDGDGKADVAVATSDNGSLSVLRNTSSGVGNINYDVLIEFTTGSAYSVSISDVDGDSKLDLVAGNSAGSVTVLRNISSGAGNINHGFITDFIAGASPQSVAIGDLDGDGKSDLAVSNSGSDNISVLRNTVSSLPMFTSSGFTPTTGPPGTVVTFTGTNFSTTPLNNIIKFNGVTALVTASSSTSITAVVPIGATTGPVSIQIGCITAISIFPFTVTAGSSIAIATQPANLSVCVNDIANLNTIATGTTNITYQWQYSTTLTGTYTDINNGGSYSNATTASLSINTSGNFGAGFYQCRITGDLATPVFTNAVELTINGLPTAPTITNGANCGTGSVTLNASGGVDGEYRWYTAATGGTAIAGEVNGNYVTPVITTTTPYFVSINDGICESLRTPVTATINSLPPIPIITSNIPLVAYALTICSTTSLTLSAPNGFASYSWSTGATTSQINVSTTGSYSVTVTDGSGCSSPASDAVIITVVPAPCNNSAPVINSTTSSTTIGGQTTINLLDLISDVDDNLVISSLVVIQQPLSGASATITNGILEIDYKGVNFSGRDQLTIQVCDVFGECTQQILEIEVIGEIEIYNGISPNNDELNDIFLIRYIELLPDTQNNKVSIYNRWGSKVFEVENYNNTTNAFRGLTDNGNELPSGTYFYKIAYSSNRKSEAGYLTLKR